jgi:hypothetical protein
VVGAEKKNDDEVKENEARVGQGLEEEESEDAGVEDADARDKRRKRERIGIHFTAHRRIVIKTSTCTIKT